MSDTASTGSGQSLGIGAIVSDSFGLAFKYFFPMLLIMIAPSALLLGVGYLLLGDEITSAMSNPTALQQQIELDPTGLLAKYGVLMVFAVIAFSFIYAATISLIFDAKSGRAVSVGSALSVGLSRAIPLFLVSMVVSILVVVVLGLVLGAVGILGIPALAAIVTLVAGLWTYGLLLPFPAAVVVEGSWFGAIGRAVGLTAGYRWWIVLLLVVFFLAIIVVQLIAALLGFVGGILGVVGIAISVVVAIVSTVIMYGAGAGMIALIYARLREIKEGTSIDTVADVFD